MKRWHRYLAAAAGVGLMTAVLSTSAARPAMAQAGPPSHHAILDAIAALGGSVESAFGTIQNSLDALTAPGLSNVRVTPPFRLNPGGSATCAVLNVSDATRQIAVDVYFLNGTRTGGHSQPVAPGTGYLLGVTASLADRTTSYCKFTVEDGSRTDIRAAAEVYEPGPAVFNAVAAMVPAE